MPDSPSESRRHLRLSLGIAARLETLAGRRNVRLIDLSQGGAHLALADVERIKAAVLTWLRFEAFGEVAWQEGEHIGLRFERSIPIPWLVETRRMAPSVVREEAMADEVAAREWIAGRFDPPGG